jgi:hypothetical protein
MYLAGCTNEGVVNQDDNTDYGNYSIDAGYLTDTQNPKVMRRRMMTHRTIACLLDEDRWAKDNQPAMRADK